MGVLLSVPRNHHTIIEVVRNFYPGSVVEVTVNNLRGDEFRILFVHNYGYIYIDGNQRAHKLVFENFILVTEAVNWPKTNVTE